MSQSFDISEELAAYFNKLDTRRAVNHMLSSDKGSDWIDLSIEEFKTSSKPFDGYDRYASAWLYSKKVQKDYFDFMQKIWTLSWSGLVSRHLGNFQHPTNFKTVEKVWEDGWYRSFDIKNGGICDDLWLYCEKLGEDQKTNGIRLNLSIGKDGSYTMENLDEPSANWFRHEDEGDHYFIRDCSFQIKNLCVEISDLEHSMSEIDLYLKNKIFKT